MLYYDLYSVISGEKSSVDIKEIIGQYLHLKNAPHSGEVINPINPELRTDVLNHIYSNYNLINSYINNLKRILHELRQSSKSFNIMTGYELYVRI